MGVVPFFDISASCTLNFKKCSQASILEAMLGGFWSSFGGFFGVQTGFRKMIKKMKRPDTLAGSENCTGEIRKSRPKAESPDPAKAILS